MCLRCSLLFPFMVDINTIPNREFYSSVLIASHVPAEIREISSFPGFSCLTSSHLRVPCTVSDHAMHRGCQWQGVPMTIPSITQGGQLPQVEPVSLHLTKSCKTGVHPPVVLLAFPGS